MKPGNPQPLTPELRVELEVLAALSDESIDTSDAPAVKDWTGARRGALHLPIKIDPDFEG
ncbi:hypothetical protein GE253_22895 [Niveispirillum sp. SYP-B3756]|uniref:hypothetical protein n=1 Tax=Niveispirillum sp. SYP-B3756 TaxID=2662178 RepID=UPI001291A9D9|nr:hypothetical protein [Niveispirillum sp. SYP-B3756]MQP68170.1 hypothetical protein [Niveispirillum sp. SYP-B3756]